jgi:hypothetical protein
MSSDKPGRDWRTRARQVSAAASPSAPAQPKSWRKRGGRGARAARPAAPAVDRRRAVYGRRLQIAGFGMLVMGMLVAWLIYLAMMPRQTPLIAFRVTQYSSALGMAPNAFAEEDIARFRDAFRIRSGTPGGERSGNTNVGFWEHARRADDVGNYPRDAFLQGFLAPLDQPRLRPGGPRKNVMLFYLSGPGTINEQGEPCLLVTDSQPFDAGSWVPLREALRALSEHPQFGSGKRVKKILFLDANRWLDHERSGTLYNDFASGLRRVVTELADPDVYVINSTSPGEIAWTSPALQGSVFGYYIAEGLNGYADKNQDGTIRLGELTEYLRDSVRSWVARRRGTVQTPQLIAAEDSSLNLPLVHAPLRPPPMAEALVDRQSEIEQQLRLRSRELAELTREYQRMLPREPYRRFPQVWGQLEFELIQADHLLMAGNAYEREYQRSVQRIQGLLKRLALPSGLEGKSLPWQHAATPELIEQTGQRLAIWRDKPIVAEWKEPLDHVAAVDLAWTWLAEGDAASKIPAAVELIERSTPTSGPELVEGYFLRLLYAHADRTAAGREIELALVARGQAEQLSTRIDPRSMAWLEQDLAELEQLRRLAEDALFLGSPSALASARERFTEHARRHAVVQQRAETLADAYALRDELLSRAPALVRWATWRSQADGSPEPLRNATELIDDLQALSRALERTDSSDLELAWPNITAVFQRLHVGLEQVKQRYSEHCLNLVETRAADQNTLHSLWQALRIPTLDPSVDRNRLRDRLITLLLENQGDVVEADPGRAARGEEPLVESPASDEGLLTSLTALDASAPLHPLVRLTDRRAWRLPAAAGRPARSAPSLDITGLTGDSLRAARAAFLAQQGALLREALSDVEPTCLRMADEARQQFAGAQKETAQDARRLLAGGDQLLRSAVPTLADSLQIESEKQPTTLLDWFDVRQIYLWQAARALDDYWGPIVADSAHFSRAATFYLELAGAAARQITPTFVPDQFLGIELGPLRQQRLESARRGLLPITRGLTLHEGEPLPDHEINLLPLEAAPPGTAYLEVTNPAADGKSVALLMNGGGGDQELERVALQVAPQGIEPSHIAHRFRRRDLPDSRLDVATFYRGHRWVGPLYITSPGFGQQVVVQPPPLTEPTVTVTGPDTRPLAIMLVFDCSYSMREKVAGDDANRTRLEIAQNAVPLMLERLPAANYRIGLTIYGHRAGTARDPQTNVRTIVHRDNATHPELSGRAGLHPTEDVQVALGLENELSARTIERIRSMLNSLRPWGQTPLYYSIRRTVEDELLRIDGNQFARRLIVITDGVNEQFQDSTTPRGVITERTDLEPLLQRMREEDIRMDVFALDMLELADDPRVAELREMAAITQGIYLDARTPAQLIEEISRVLRPGEFAIRRPTETAAPMYQALGATWKPDAWQGERAEYVLSGRGVGREVRDHPFRLEGGEALEVKLVGDEFVHSRYRPGEFFEEERTQDGSFYLWAPIPRRVSGSGVHFQVALQRHPETRFTPRPRHVWAEITPLGSRTDRNARSPMLAFYDLEFVPGRPVPVLQFRTTNWPEFASEAEMRLWFRLEDDIAPNETFSIANLREPARFSGGGVPGVEFEVELVSSREGSGRELKVWEIHSPDAPIANLHTLRVQVEPQGDEWSHRFIPDSRRVLHTFKYSGNRQPSQLMVTTRERITSGAQALEKPFRLVLERR